MNNDLAAFPTVQMGCLSQLKQRQSRTFWQPKSSGSSANDYIFEADKDIAFRRSKKSYDIDIGLYLEKKGFPGIKNVIVISTSF